MKRHFFIIGLAILSSSLTSFGQQKGSSYPIDKKLQSCIESNGSTMGMVECTQKAQNEWDKELNKYYKLLLGKLDASDQQFLRESQRQWLAYKEKETKFYMRVYGKQEGSMWSNVIADKALQITRQRAIELMDYYGTLTQN